MTIYIIQGQLVAHHIKNQLVDKLKTPPPPKEKQNYYHLNCFNIKRHTQRPSDETTHPLVNTNVYFCCLSAGI